MLKYLNVLQYFNFDVLTNLEVLKTRVTKFSKLWKKLVYKLSFKLIYSYEKNYRNRSENDDGTCFSKSVI